MYVQNFLFELFWLPTIFFFGLNLLVSIGAYYFNHVKWKVNFWKISILIGTVTIVLSYLLSVILDVIQCGHFLPTMTDLLVVYFDYSFFTIILTFISTMITSGLCLLVVKAISMQKLQVTTTNSIEV